MPYFAWIDPAEDTFGPEHLRWDEQVFSFDLKQDEGDPASLTIVVRRPRNVAGDPIGLLGPGRKIWAWFAFDCGPDLVRFRGRLVGVPTSLFEELVTLEFVARPIDLVAQKEALAESLRVLPYYDEVVIDESRRNDPEVVLEAYSAIWHYDRETHVVTVSDEIDGEDGLVEFDGASEDGKVLYDGLALTLTSGPLTRVDVAAEYTWTQQARGSVDLTSYLTKNWPNEAGAEAGTVTSFSFTADNWPKPGAGIGDGWEVAARTAFAVNDLEVHVKKIGGAAKIKWPESEGGGSTSWSWEQDDSFLNPVPLGSISFGTIITEQNVNVTYGQKPSEILAAADVTLPFATGMQYRYAEVGCILPLNHTRVTLVAAYTANRQCTERVSFSLYADVQHILSNPEDGEALRVADVRSVNLSESIGEGTGAVVPIGDSRRRSYIATARGNQSLEHLIALARANLLKRARVVEIAFAPKLARMPEITLRKNAFLAEPRVGEALGKIIGYSLALDGADGQIKCEVRMGCTIGRGGSAVAAGGEPTYCEIAYTGADYQQFTGRTVLFDSSVGYQPPNANPNDDGINFLSTITAEDVIAIPLSVEWPLSAQRTGFAARAPRDGSVPPGDFPSVEANQATVDARAEAAKNYLQHVETKATFKLKPMSREFSSDYEIEVTDLKIPSGYDLEAV